MRELKFYGKDQTSRETWDQVITQRIPFNAGNMSGLAEAPAKRHGVYGQLPAEYAKELDNSSVDYVVYSWQTPIMWHDSATDKWRFPRVTYSQSTSRHQSHAEYSIKIWDGERWNTPSNFDDSGPRMSIPCGGR